MGLAAAWEAARAGHQVTVLEADRIPGGMAAHFDFDGLSIERFYHFICKTDFATFELLAELGISDRLRWRDTSMGYFINDRHYAWGTPWALLRFPLLSFADRLRYGWQVRRASQRTDWSSLHGTTVRDWIISEAGERVWNLMWARSFELKFFEYANQVAAPWLGVRIRRLAASRKSIFQEQLGYLEGGSESLVTALAESLQSHGGDLRCGEGAVRILARDGSVEGVATASGSVLADAVICTAPVPLVPRLLPEGHGALAARYAAIKNIGAVCVVLKLRRPVTRHFWVNINDPDILVPGIVEFSNLRMLGNDHVVYVPFYMPQDNPRFGRPDETFIAESLAALRRLNPALTQADLLASRVGRLRHAQPICEPGFPDLLPPIETPIAGLQVADTCYYYPEDRGISESVRVGREMARRVR
jgi:protoporphyrinogen oxidase